MLKDLKQLILKLEKLAPKNFDIFAYKRTEWLIDYQNLLMINYSHKTFYIFLTAKCFMLLHADQNNQKHSGAH